MPWNANDAPGSTKKAKSAKEKRQWAHIANAELAAGKSEGEAKMIANGVIKNQKKKGSNRFGYRAR